MAGAGIAGVSTAYELAVRRGVDRVVVCDARPSMSLTSDKSTECYRNWWPHPAMVGLMNRSIDLLESLECRLTGRGYVYFTASPEHLGELEAGAKAVSQKGAGPFRLHQTLSGPPPCDAARDWHRATRGADLVTDPDLIRRLFPAVGHDVVGALHVRRAGWLDAHQLGAQLVDASRAAGVELIRHMVVAVDVGPRGVRGVELDDGTHIETPTLVSAAGPHVADVTGLIGESLPVFAELHLKVAFRDHLGVVPRDAPLMIWDDPQRIPWDDDERDGLQEQDPLLLEELPAGCHLRPEGGSDSPWVLGLWEFRHTVMNPVFPVPVDRMYPEVVLRGLSKMIPGLDAYRGRIPKTVVDGGYYLRTAENLPLIGPLRTPGAFVIGALSGFGIMASQAAAELVALHITGETLPSYADTFRVDRFDDPDYTPSADTGQL